MTQQLANNLYYLNSRYYSPIYYRFISIDDIDYLKSESINGISIYAYCGNDPINYTDPSGNLPKWAAWLISGIAIVAVYEVANLACIGYMTLGVAASFTGGFVGNLAGTVYTSWHNSGFKNVEIDLGETLATSVIMGSLNIFAGMGSAMSSIAGTMGKIATDVNFKFALRFLAGLIAGSTEAAYDLTSYLLGKLISAF